jgi:outer membrane protein OmpA-like peptidoglycan-associated protein
MKSTTSKLTALVLSLTVLLLIGCAGKTALQGKVVISQQKLPYIAHQKLLLKHNNRTAYATVIDGFGFFEFTGVRRNRDYSIEFDSLSKKLDGSVFYIANMNGKKIKEIDLRKSFAFDLLPLEFNSLASLQDDDLDEKIKEFKSGTAGSELLVKKYIQYETGSYEISKENRKYMNAIARVLKDNKQFILRVNSHADATGNDDFNLTLSVKRANEIKTYLVKKGIAADRIMTYGYGETRPLNNCTNGVNCSELQHRQNRRTEFVFKTKKGTDVSVRS